LHTVLKEDKMFYFYLELVLMIDFNMTSLMNLKNYLSWSVAWSYIKTLYTYESCLAFIFWKHFLFY